MMPLFSIVIPTHNRAKLLKRAIESVLNQSYKNWELIVVDDGSRDETRELVAGISDQRIRYIYQEHQDRSTARNVGIGTAKGKYVCFLDDDDCFLSDHLSILHATIVAQQYPVAIFRTGMLVKHGHHIKKSPFYAPSKYKNPVSFFLENMTGIHTLCFHQEILSRYRFDYRWYYFEDTHLLVRALLDYPFFQIHKHTCVYVRHAEMGSYTTMKRIDVADRVENNVAAIRDLFKVCNPKIFTFVSSEMESFLVAQKYLGWAIGVLRIHRFELARLLFLNSIKTQLTLKLWRMYIQYAFYNVKAFLEGIF